MTHSENLSFFFNRDGVTDNYPIFLAADAAGEEIHFHPGRYAVSRDFSFTSRVRFARGARLIIPSGVTITFTRGLEAGVFQIFEGAGTVSVSAAYRPSGYAEWWGAVSGDVSANCTPAINKAISVLQKVELMPADYFGDETVSIEQDNKTLKGAGCQYKNEGATRVLVKSDSLPAVFVGRKQRPESIEDHLNAPALRDIYFGRDRAPLISSNCPAGLFKFTIYAQIRNCKFDVSMRGAEFVGNVKLVCEDSFAFRSVAGSGAGSDYFQGFYANGNITIGSGGNASLFFNRCNASVGGLPLLSCGNSTGFLADAGFADIFLSDFETVGCSVGIAAAGDASAYGNVDLHIRNPIIDGFYKAGILISNTSESGAIEISGGYAAPATTSQYTSWAVWLNGSKASISLSGFQGICGPSATCGGLLIESSKNVISQGCSWIDSRIQSVFVNNSSAVQLRDSVKHINRTASGMGAVYVGGTCAQLDFNCQVTGSAASVGYGYQIVGTGVIASQFACTGIDPASLSGGAGSKISNNGAPVTSAGVFGSNNLASGVMS